MYIQYKTIARSIKSNQVKVFELSESQPADIWDQIINENIDGVIICLGETILKKQEMDSLFEEHMENAIKYNIPFGISFITHADTIDVATVEAEWIDKMIQKYLEGQEPELGIWINCEARIVQMIAANSYAIHIIDKLKLVGYSQVGICADYYFYNDYMDLDYLESYQVPVWTIDYSNENGLKAERPSMNHVGWRYTEGYEGMDMAADIWYD